MLPGVAHELNNPLTAILGRNGTGARAEGPGRFDEAPTGLTAPPARRAARIVQTARIFTVCRARNGVTSHSSCERRREIRAGFCTILAARRAWRCSSPVGASSNRPGPRARAPVPYAENRRQRIVQLVRDAGKHLPDRSELFDWISCSPSRFSSVMSRPERTTPSIFPLSSNSGLKLKRMRRHSPSLCRRELPGS